MLHTHATHALQHHFAQPQHDDALSEILIFFSPKISYAVSTNLVVVGGLGLILAFMILLKARQIESLL
jgi:hypothetical protein